MQTADLFAGIGGLTLSFAQAGYKHIFANDNDEKCALTFNANFSPSLILQDIQRPGDSLADSVEKQLQNCAPKVLLAGFPCQSWSQAGQKQGFADGRGRGQLVLTLLQTIVKTQPAVVFLENVSNLIRFQKGKVLQLILQSLEKNGYTSTYRLLKSDEYGNLPQQRQRFYLIAFRKQEAARRFVWPAPIERTTTVFDLLEPKVDGHYYYFWRGKGQKPLWNTLKNYHLEKDKIYLWRRDQLRVYKNGICPTLLASMGTGGHNVPLICDQEGVRKLTPRECARLQGFPDNFILPKTLAEKTLYQQIGNSVAVPVARRLAVAINQARPY